MYDSYLERLDRRLHYLLIGADGGPTCVADVNRSEREIRARDVEVERPSLTAVQVSRTRDELTVPFMDDALLVHYQSFPLGDVLALGPLGRDHAQEVADPVEVVGAPRDHDADRCELASVRRQRLVEARAEPSVAGPRRRPARLRERASGCIYAGDLGALRLSCFLCCGDCPPEGEEQSHRIDGVWCAGSICNVSGSLKCGATLVIYAVDSKPASSSPSIAKLLVSCQHPTKVSLILQQRRAFCTLRSRPSERGCPHPCMRVEWAIQLARWPL